MAKKWIISWTIAVSLSTVCLSMVCHAQTDATPVTLRAKDGVVISGLVYEAPHPKATILLFHQAGSSKAEYAAIAPRLVAAGYSALAIDQRSGGSLYGPNETASRLKGEATYDQAKLDLEAALDWAAGREVPAILCGSSYSAALVFEVAAEHERQINAVIAFSPGEYLADGAAVARAAARVHVPIYVTSSPNAGEISAARAILAASPARLKIQYAPKFGVHGASTLIEVRDPKGAKENWDHVLAFLAALPANR